MKKLRQIAIIIALLCIFTLGACARVESAENEYLLAYWASDFSDETPQIAADFLTNMQEILKEYDIKLNIIRYLDMDDLRVRDRTVIRFHERLNTDNDIVGTDAIIFTQADNFTDISPILENDYPIYFSLENPDAENIFLGLILYSVGRYTEAESILLAVQNTQMHYISGNIELYLGNLRLLQEDYEGAIEFYELNYWSDMGHFFGVNLAWTYFQVNRIEESFELLNYAIEVSDEFFETSPAYLRSVRAQLYALAFDYDSAIADIDSAIELAEEYDFDNTALAELYTLRGEIIFLIYEWDRVLDNFNYAIELNPTYAPAYFQRGVLYYTMAQRELALEDFETYLELASEGEYIQQSQDYIESIQIELEALEG